MEGYAPSATKYAATVIGILLLGAVFIPVVDAASVLGFMGDRTYLIVLQDNGELRNTGGITSVTGVVTVHNGDVKNVSFFYAGVGQRTGAPTGVLVTLDGPESFTHFFANKMYLFDANVQYDFATYAPFLSSAYRNETGRQVDGVIAIDLTAAEAMLSMTGPLTVAGQTLTSRNLADQLYAHSSVSKGGVTELITELFTKLIETVRGLPLPLQVEFVRSMQRMGSEKHIQFYVPGDFLTRPYSGARAQSPGDFIDIIDYNLGEGKADPGITRTMSYHVELRPDGSSVSNLTVRYVNHNWWNYTVFTTALVPPDATLVGGSHTGLKFAGPKETHEAGVTAFTGQLRVAPHSTGSVTYRYTMPRAVNNDAVGLRYDLDVHKQAGINEYTFTTDVQLPPGATLMHASNVGTQTVRNDAHVQVIYNG